ncbi:unnamed protein product [Nippostrongylus brasiliensis]|uniref:DUF659 domain-containing protein n=1 Tax=Nippostrongylus brasiliensis TaxID=27835 RepID=A0A0N4YFR2_NIPBR|nr:unnamed protein product [Nippostrongylus brasiliensis]
MAATVISTLVAYTIAKEGLAYTKQFPLLMMAVRSGAISSTAHYQAPSAQRMVKQFALHMKFDILDYIIRNDLPFSLLADGTSNEGVMRVVFLLRTVSTTNRPITFHFSLVEVESESAEDIVNSIVELLQRYNLWAGPSGLWTQPYEYSMRKLVALSSDGASVMTGNLNGVHAQLKRLLSISEDNTRKDLLLSICSAHKLNLAVSALSSYAIKLTQAIIMEMHHLFGSNLRTKGRLLYSKASEDMGFCNLHMDKLHKVRWSASLQLSLTKILRINPVSIESPYRLESDNSVAQNMRKRAEIALWALRDGRTFIILQHMNAALRHLTSMSKALQKEESLVVDHYMQWRKLHDLLETRSIEHDVYRTIREQEILGIPDQSGGKLLKCHSSYLKAFTTYVPGSREHDDTMPVLHLAYDPKKFDDYNKFGQISKMDPEVRRATGETRQLDFFRDIDATRSEPDIVDEDLPYHTDDAPNLDSRQLATLTPRKVYMNGMKYQGADDHIEEFYDQVKTNLRFYMTPGKRES